MRIIILTIFLCMLSTKVIYAITINDIDVLKGGQILAHKVYSNSEATYVVNRNSSIYICSVIQSSTSCLLSANKYIDLSN